MDSDSSISSRSCSVSAKKSIESTSESFQMPSQSAKKKIFRRTNAQIVLDNMKKMSEKSAKVEAQKESKLKTLGLNKLETKAETKSECRQFRLFLCLNFCALFGHLLHVIQNNLSTCAPENLYFADWLGV